MGSIGATKHLDVANGFYNTINGKLTTTEKTRHGINPATGKPNPEVPVSTQKDVDDAVAAAKEAFKSWSKVPWDERKKAVLAYADAVEAHAEDFAKLLTQEQGKPVRIDTLTRVVDKLMLLALASICKVGTPGQLHLAEGSFQH